MKDLVGKIATIAAPTLFEGEKECRGFEYTESGQGLRWEGMPKGEFVPIGLISVLGTPVAEKKASEPAGQKASETELALKLRIAALEAQLAEKKAGEKTSGGESGKGSEAPAKVPAAPPASTPSTPASTKTEEPRK
jgi:hypothetical protein